MPSNHKKNSRSQLEQLLFTRRFALPTECGTIDATIQETFGTTQAVLVLDSSGFSRNTLQQGIIAALSLIQQMQSIVMPAVMTHAGNVVKLDADNIFAIFPDPDCAVESAIDIFRRLNAANLHASIGIGYGDMLFIEGLEPYASDLYGNEVNLASKLGEDLAEKDELLLTAAAFEKLVRPDVNDWQPVKFEISGVQLVAQKYLR